MKLLRYWDIFGEWLGGQGANCSLESLKCMMGAKVLVEVTSWSSGNYKESKQRTLSFRLQYPSMNGDWIDTQTHTQITDDHWEEERAHVGLGCTSKASKIYE